MPLGPANLPPTPGPSALLPAAVVSAPPLLATGATMPVTPVAPPPPLQPPAPPPPPPPPPAQIPPVGKLQERLPPEKIKNVFERRAAMIVQTAEDWAQKLADNLGDHPADYAPADDSVVHEMFHFSPFGLDAPYQFWKQHDELLQMAIQNNDPDPYAVAERGAMDAVYPYRAKIALLDALAPEQRVQRAEQLQRIAERQAVKGNPPEALPSIVGPAALPPPAGGQ